MRTSPHTRVIALTAALAASAIGSRAFAQDIPAGWTPEWSDEFNGTGVDANRWNVLTRQDSYNNEQQYYTPNAVTVSGGLLNITARKQTLGNKSYTSGLIRTKSQQQYGRWEVKASLPTTQGMWPAIWLLAPDNVPWPTGGEIDIMENRGSAPTIVGSAYHYGTDAGAGHKYVSKDFSYSANGTPVSFQGSMHTYGVEWDPNRIRYLIDNVPSFTFYKTIPVSSTPMDMLINLAVGGDFGGNVNSSTVFPQTLSVDYVHSFSRDNTTRALNNGNFEAKSGTLFQEWDEYSNGGGNVLPDSVTSNARSGSTAVQMYGRFNGQTNTSGLFQEVPTTPGEVWQVGAFTKNRPGDTLAGGNNARIRIEFIDQNGAVINNSQLITTTSASPTEYREGVIRKVAPANAVFARAVLEMQQLANAGGAVDFDDASIRRVTATSAAGDVNLDGLSDSRDIDALFHSLTADNTAFDFNNSGSVTSADVDSFLASAFNTRRGDANLDHAVNFDDLIVLAQNYNKVGTGTWATGDFTGDSNVNFDDLIQLAKNYNFNGNTGSTIGGLSSTSFQNDWALAQSLVPEPTVMLTGIATAGGLMRRRRRN